MGVPAMRVKAPGDGPPPLPAIDATGAAEAAARADSVAEVAPLTGVRPTGAAEADPIVEVARRLKAGEISAADAVALLIDEVVQRQTEPLGGDRRALADELKAILREQIENDPYLASRVRRLGNHT